MPHATDPSNEPLAQLEAAKNRFEPGHSAVVAKLLAKVSKLQIDDPRQLIRFHEVLLFLRAFPHAPSQIPRVEHLLNTFSRRVEKLSSSADMSVFDDFDTSGIAGATMQDTLSFDVAQWLAQRIPANVEIAWNDYWDDYQSERARGNTWPRFIPLLKEDADVEANIPWRQWIDTARGTKQPLAWLLGCFARLPLTSRQQSELYDSLRLPIRWRLENLRLSRTRNWARPRRFYFHDRSLIQRNEVSLSNELAQPDPKFEKLFLAAGKSVLQTIKEVMVVRYRELYGTTLGDPRSVLRVQLGRGVTMHFWGLPADRRLPLRAYLAGYTEKNGVPINYIEAIGLCEWIEVGFNTFYTYRQGETAWIYAQALRCLRALTGAKCFSVYPYQIGQNNDEAIDSGAFWFYRKLGFRSGRADLRRLCEREERKIASDPKYRTPPRTLKRLAEAHMFYELPPTDAAAHEIGAWDRFSVRNLGLLVNRRMSQEFDGDSEKIRTASVAAVTRALNVDSAHWTPLQKRALANWSLVLAVIPGLSRWPAQERQKLVEMIRAKLGSNEMKYLRLTQRHSRFRKELLGVGSNFNHRVSVAAG